MKKQRIRLYGIFIGSLGIEVFKNLQFRPIKNVTGCYIDDKIPNHYNLPSLKEICLSNIMMDLEIELKKMLSDSTKFYLVCKLDDIIAEESLPLIIAMLKEMKITAHCFCVLPENSDGQERVEISSKMINLLRKNRISSTHISPEKWKSEEYQRIFSSYDHVNLISSFTAKVVSYYIILTEHLMKDTTDIKKTMVEIKQMLPKLIDNTAYDE